MASPPPPSSAASPSRFKAPKRSTVIFLSVLGALVGGHLLYKREQRRLQQEHIAAVAHHGAMPLAATAFPRRLTIFVDPERDGYKALKFYVRPILAAAAIDWEYIDGPAQARLRAAQIVAGLPEDPEHRKLRLKDDWPNFNPSRQEFVAVGAHMYAEVLNGIADGLAERERQRQRREQEQQQQQKDMQSKSSGSWFSWLFGGLSSSSSAASASSASTLRQKPSAVDDIPPVAFVPYEYLTGMRWLFTTYFIEWTRIRDLGSVSVCVANERTRDLSAADLERLVNNHGIAREQSGKDTSSLQSAAASSTSVPSSNSSSPAATAAATTPAAEDPSATSSATSTDTENDKKPKEEKEKSKDKDTPPPHVTRLDPRTEILIGKLKVFDQ